MTAGSARWYQICERLGRTPLFTSGSPTSLAVRLRADVTMTDAASHFAMSTSLVGKKRGRDDAETEDEGVACGLRFEKKARPTAGGSSHWPHDSVISAASMQPPGSQQAKYDSDDQSSMVSEPGSPQDMEMSDDDEMLDSDSRPAFSQPSDTRSPFQSNSTPWQTRPQNQRVSTPSIQEARPGVRPIQLRTHAPFHVRGRHPQENLSSSSDAHLEVPSPIDEDEVPTPPSAAEAAGSQLSMLTVNDMDISPPPDSGLPTISVDDRDTPPAQTDPAVDVEPMDGAPSLTVRKPRQRSGAVSSGHGNGGSPSPVRGGGWGGEKRGFSMGFRADCEKCRLRVPGHMNHFIAS